MRLRGVWVQGVIYRFVGFFSVIKGLEALERASNLVGGLRGLRKGAVEDSVGPCRFASG